MDNGIVWLIVFGIIGLWIYFANKGDDSERTSAEGAPGVRVEKLQIRLRAGRIKDSDQDSPMVQWIEGKGLLPHRQTTNISFFTSLLDKSARGKPVLCPFEQFQEPETIVYQFIRQFGAQPPGGFREWDRLGMIIPVLIPPYGGQRKLTAVLRVIDADNAPEIMGGQAANPSHPGLLWEGRLNFDWHYDGKGYEEEAAHRNEARSLSVKIAMAAAMADGGLDNEEGVVIKQWIEREISPYEGERREQLKDLYNSALRESYADAKRGVLDLEQLAHRLNEVGEKTAKYETTQLCFDVMSADGFAHEAEMETIHRLTRLLGMDKREVEMMRDKAIVGMDASDDAGAENLLGIDPGWDDEQLKKHLRDEFIKWNGRLQTHPQEARRMLDLIAEEKKNLDKRGAVR